MNERICKFGDDGKMLGILTGPESGESPAGLPAVILLNAGLLHHVGQNRLNVMLARRLAQLGYRCFRFDFSGIGDSRPRQSSASVRERNTEEILQAIDYLEKSQGINAFVLIGLCTGADNAHRAAVADARVTAIVMLDGYSYPTMSYFVRRFRKKLFRPANWANFVASHWYRLRNRRHASRRESAESVTYFWVLPKKRQAEEDLVKLASRNVRMLQIFSGGNIAYNYAEQYRDSFRRIDFRDLLQVSYIAEADHTYSIRSDRERMLSIIENWLSLEFPPVAGVPSVRAAS